MRRICIGIICLLHAAYADVGDELKQIYNAVYYMSDHITTNLANKTLDYLSKHPYIKIPDEGEKAPALHHHIANAFQHIQQHILNTQPALQTDTIDQHFIENNIIVKGNGLPLFSPAQAYSDTIHSVYFSPGWYQFEFYHRDYNRETGYVQKETAYTDKHADRKSIHIKTEHINNQKYKNHLHNLLEIVRRGRIKRDIKKEFHESINHLQNMYKIHIMPHNDDVLPIVTKIIQEYKNLPAEEQALLHLKFSKQMRLSMRLSQQVNFAFLMPRIVLYPMHEKRAAENILKWILNILQDYTGIGLYPRFNTRVNDLVYYIQGNADDRISPFGPSLFDQDTDYTYIDIEKIKNIAQQEEDSNLNELPINETQKLIHPDTKEPFSKI